MVAWALLLWRGLTMPIQLLPVDTEAPLSRSFYAAVVRSSAALLGHVLLMTFFFTGMFITAHDAMHGTVAPHFRKLNDGIGSVCVRCFALFDYSMLLRAHWEHHRHPATANDPDFHPPGTDFWRWYVHFMQEYASVRQLTGMGLMYNVRTHLRATPLPAFQTDLTCVCVCVCV